MIPFTVIGGFLGAGKTTLLNRLLAGTAGRRFAVLVNDFGALDIDGRLIAEHGGDTVSLANGCLCCSIGDSLAETVLRLLERPERFDHVVVEASGVSDPARIADLAVLEPQLIRDGVVVVVDAWDVRVRADDRRIGDTILRQIKAADLLVLNKVDIAEDVAGTRAWLGQHTPAPVLEARRGNVPLDLLFGLGRLGAAGGAPDESFRSWSYEWAEPVDRETLLALLRDARDVLRAKGIVRFADAPDRRSVVHRVGRRIDVSEDGPWPGGPSQLVLLGPKPQSALMAGQTAAGTSFSSL
jgi:G3E family GTPase